MKEFIDLEDSAEVTLTKININNFVDVESADVSLVKINSLINEIIELENFKDINVISCLPEEIPVNDCDNDCYNDSYYTCSTDDGSFKLDNLFSELSTDYQRALARLNLGIGDEFTNEWGNIKGNINNQKDLIDFLNSYLSHKANLNSPIFTGLPLAPKPKLNDSSYQIATTNWVMDQINNLDVGGGGNNGNLVKISITPTFAYKGDGDVLVTVSWKYIKPVNKQSINGEILSNSIRNYSKTVTTDTEFKLTYEYDGIQESKYVAFIYKSPIYYGVNLNNLNKTINNKITIDVSVNEHALIFINSNTVKFSVNGFVGGFKKDNTQIINNEVYYLFKSINHSLGLINIDII